MKRLLILFFLLFIAQSSFAAVTRVSTNTIGTPGGGGTSLSDTINVTGTNTYLIIIFHGSWTNHLPTACTFNAVSCGTPLYTDGTNQIAQAVYGMYPDSGSHTLSLSFDSGDARLTWILYNGVHQTTPVGTIHGAFSYGGVTSVTAGTITDATADDYVVGALTVFVSSHSAWSITDSVQTQISNAAVGASTDTHYGISGDHAGTGSNIVLSWGGATDDRDEYTAFAIKASGGGGPGPSRVKHLVINNP